MSAPDFSTRPRRRRARPLDLALVGTAALALALSAHSAWTAWADARRTGDALERVRREADATRSRARALEAKSGRGAGALASRALLTSVAPPPRVLADLAAILPGDVRLESLSLGYGEHLELDLQVVARRAGSYDIFLERLSASQAFAQVVPGAESRNGEVRAGVSAVYSVEGEP